MGGLPSDWCLTHCRVCVMSILHEWHLTVCPHQHRLWGVTRVKCSGIVCDPHSFSVVKSWDADPEDLRKRAESAALPAWEHSMNSGQKMARTVPAALSPTELSMGDSSFDFVASSIISQKYRQWQWKNLSGCCSLFVDCGSGEGGEDKVTNVRCWLVPL